MKKSNQNHLCLRGQVKNVHFADQVSLNAYIDFPKGAIIYAAERMPQTSSLLERAANLENVNNKHECTMSTRMLVGVNS
jgi:hypothetical protein